MTPLAPLHPTHPTEPTPLFAEIAAVIDLRTRRARLTVIDGEQTARLPRCRPTERRLRILNDGTGVTGGLLWNA